MGYGIFMFMTHYFIYKIIIPLFNYAVLYTMLDRNRLHLYNTINVLEVRLSIINNTVSSINYYKLFIYLVNSNEI